MGGFKKEGVINYIEQLQAEIFRLKNELAEKNSEAVEIEGVRKENAAMEAAIAEYRAEIVRLNAVIENNKTDAAKEIDEYKAEIEKLNSTIGDEKTESSKEIEEYKAEIERLNSALEASKSNYEAELDECKKEYEEKVRTFEDKIASIEDKFAAIESCCAKLEDTDLRIDAIMKNAQTSSDALLANAKEVNRKASSAVASASKTVAEANEKIKTACYNFESSAAVLKSGVENLISILDDLMGAEA